MNKLLPLIFFSLLSLSHINADAQTSDEFEKKADSFSISQDGQSAITFYKKAIALSDKDPIKLSGLYNKLAATESQLKQYKEAIEDATTAIKLAPENNLAYWNRAGAYEAINAHQQAVNDYTMVISTSAGGLGKEIMSRLYANRADANFGLKKYNESISDDSTAISLNPKNKDAYWHKGIVYHKLGKYQASIDNYKSALMYEDDKGNMAALLDNIANNEQSLAQYSKAIDHENTAISLMPDQAKYYWNRGLAYQRNRDYLLAIDDFNKCMPSYQDSKTQLSTLYSNRALNELYLLDYTKTIADDSVAVTLNPKSGYAHWMMGAAYAQLANFQMAISKYQTAVGFYADNKNRLAAIYSDWASGEYRMNDGKKSLEHCMQAISLDPKNGSVYFIRGKIYLKKLHNSEAAMKDFKKVIELDTTKKGENYILALYYTGDSSTALQLMKNKLLTTTNSSDILTEYYNMACLLSLMNQPTEANNYLKAAVDKGFQAKFAAADDDLDSIRNTTEFKNLIANSGK